MANPFAKFTNNKRTHEQETKPVASNPKEVVEQENQPVKPLPSTPVVAPADEFDAQALLEQALGTANTTPESAQEPTPEPAPEPPKPKPKEKIKLTKKIPIGKCLVLRGFITEEQLDENLAELSELNKQEEEECKKEGRTFKKKMFGEHVIEKGYITEEDFSEILAERIGKNYVNLSFFQFDPEIVKLIPEETAKKENVIALEEVTKGNRTYITVATTNAANLTLQDALRTITGMDIELVTASSSGIEKAINKQYAETSVNKVVSAANEQLNEMTATDEEDGEIDTSQNRIESAPIVKLATTIVENSFRQDATDIHIEAFETYTIVRIRVNGDLIKLMEIGSNLHSSLITRFKILSGMNIAEKRIPQDGRMSQVVDGTKLDLRVSNLPCVHGEKVVIRILATGDVALRKITDLGMNDYNYQKFESMLKVPQGVMLVTGPTGSGKTTTLYAALGEMAKPHVNVITVEDPVEKAIEGINQCQINDKAGMTFAAALRSILRQDPDIIMVGEMRDQETSEIAIRAAITGHMVLSTLHTNDAASTVTRLTDMGVAAYMVATSLIGIVAQRLTKKLCPECKHSRMSTPAENELMGIDHSIEIYEAGQCPACGDTGYKGRTAIHEILLNTSEMAILITSDAKADAIAALAKEQGTRLLRDNVSELVQNGVTSIDELVRVTYTV